MLSDGILLIDKPPDVTSAHVVSRVKRLLKVKKVGHAGTLDPFATGLLICPINNATRISQFLIHERKSYEATLKLGVTTDTQDLTGKVIATNSSCDRDAVTQDVLLKTFATFMGNRLQHPPAFSALKHHGIPLYTYARKGIPIQKDPRPITIFQLDLIAFNPPDIRFKVFCSAGTYIRTLAHDIGQKLGCGAHLIQLRRTQTLGFNVTQALPFDAIVSHDQDIMKHLIPMPQALAHLKKITADKVLKEIIRFGRPLTKAVAPVLKNLEPQKNIAVISEQNDLLAVIQYDKKKNIYKYCCVFNNTC